MATMRPWLLAFALALFGLAPAQAQVAAIGASNTAGFGLSSSEAYPAKLEALLRAKGIAVSVSNLGNSGEQTPTTLARIDGALSSGTRLVILNPGYVNDSPRSRAGAANPIPRERTFANVDAMVAKIKGRGIPVILLGEAAGAGAIKVSSYGGLNQSTDIQSDGVHYSAAGHAKIAQRLLPVVERALRGR